MPHENGALEDLGRTMSSNSTHRQNETIENVDDWLAVPGVRNAKWYYSAFHNVTAMVGAGVLAFPYCMAQLGWGLGALVVVLSWIITLYTLWQMVEMHEIVPGKRFDRYHELGQYAFGKKLGLWVVVPQQLIVEVGIDIVYMVTGGMSLQAFHDLVRPHETKQICLSLWIIIFASPQFLLSQLPNFNAIAGVSLAAAIMSVSYCTLAVGAVIHKGIHHQDAPHEYKLSTAANEIFQTFSALGTVAFAYAGHNVVLEIQATIPSTPKKPSKIAMWRGVLAAYCIVALCYFGVAFCGYWAFGNKVEEDILTSVVYPKGLVAAANLMVVVHVIGAYQIYAMPVFDILEILLVKLLHIAPGIMLRLVTRSLYVAFTGFVAITIPFFKDLMGFFGGFGLAPTTYFLPCIMWLCICKPKPFTPSWLTNWICIILGVILMILSSIGGLRQIIINAKDYRFYNSTSTPHHG